MLQGKLTTESTLTGSIDCGFVEPTLAEKNITANGIYNASADNVDGYSKVNVDVEPTLAEKNITANGIYNASADNIDGYSKVNVDVEPTLAEKNITANGTYNASADNVDGYSKVNVNVPSSGSDGIACTNNGTLEFFYPTTQNISQVLVNYTKYSFNGKTWTYIKDNTYKTGVFQISRPTGIKANNDLLFIAGYHSQSLFWQTAGNDKCTALGSSYINISDDSFNGDVLAFAQYMNDKFAYLPLSNTQTITYT